MYTFSSNQLKGKNFYFLINCQNTYIYKLIGCELSIMTMNDE